MLYLNLNCFLVFLMETCLQTWKIDTLATNIVGQGFWGANKCKICKLTLILTAFCVFQNLRHQRKIQRAQTAQCLTLLTQI